jgi:hypothetical protein
MAAANKVTFTVVENAGYEGENDRRGFRDANAAWRWAKRKYGIDELESLHVQVRRDCGDEQTYCY